MTNKTVLIIGAGGHAAEIRDYIRHYNQHNSTEQIEVTGFIDDNEKPYEHYGFEEPFLGSIKDHKVRTDCYYLMGIANLKYRQGIIERFLKAGGKFTGLIHPTALISPSATIGEGVVISHNASVGPKVKIGNFNMLNSRCTIGHDTQMGDYNFISPKVALSGNTQIGNNNMIGTNASTIPSAKIGNNNIIGAGMVVYKNISDDETVFFRFKERLVIKENSEE
jgi:acetyltransferase EpsM